jgi:hypothetical protein
MPKITVTVIGADNKLSDSLSNSIVEERGYKYTYLKQLISRLRMVKAKNANLTEEEQMIIISNTLIVERNIANFAAEQYAELGQDELFDSFTEIVSDIEELFN